MRRRPAPDFAAERGSLLIEVIVGVFILTVGLLATLGILSQSNHLATTTQRQQAAAAIAESQMETLRATSYANLVLSSLPVHTSDGNSGSDTTKNPANPDYWVSGSNLLIPQSWSLETSATLTGVSASGEALVYNTSTGTISPGPSIVTGPNNYTATVYRFITWVDDKCTYASTDRCSGSQNAKRLTVAVVLGGITNRGVTKPVWVSTVVANPNAGQGG